MKRVKIDISIKFSVAACLFGLAAVMSVLVH
jgi:hypothetical protein